MGAYRPPGDKSLSHRALLLASLAGGPTELFDLNPGADVEATARALRALGVSVRRSGSRWVLASPGASALRRPGRRLDCGNSGTTMRLLAGLLAGCPFPSELFGDRSLSSRPMGRIVEPLERMGAQVAGRRADGRTFPPLRIQGGRLRPIRHVQQVASAQVKSAILLAAWTAGVRAEVHEAHRSRDHTERMLRALGADVRRIRGGVVLTPRGRLEPPRGKVPADPSAGAFFAAAAAALPGSDLVLKGVCLNPTRLGFYRALERMGARVESNRVGSWCGEPFGDLRVRAGPLRGIRIGARTVPSLIDEVPILCVLAAIARGETRVTGAAELRAKESDRIETMVAGLAALGVPVLERPDGMIVTGSGLLGGTVDAQGDHRIAMAFRIAGVVGQGPVRIRGASAMRVSHPGFDGALRRLRVRGSG